MDKLTIYVENPTEFKGTRSNEGVHQDDCRIQGHHIKANISYAFNKQLDIEIFIIINKHCL